MQFLHSPLFWILAYLAVAALVFCFSPKPLAWVKDEAEFGDWVTSGSFRLWLSAIWLGFFAGVLVVAVIAIIVLGCSRVGGAEDDRPEDDLDTNEGALPEEGAES